MSDCLLPMDYLLKEFQERYSRECQDEEVGKYLLSIFVGGLFLWLAFRGEDWSRIQSQLQSVSYMGCWLIFCCLLLRMRFRSYSGVFWFVRAVRCLMAYFCNRCRRHMAIMVLPFRLGEFVRPYLIKGEKA